MKNVTAQNTAIAIIAAPNTYMSSLGAVLRDYKPTDAAVTKAEEGVAAAKAKLATAQKTRAKMVTTFRDVCVTFGWVDLSPIKRKGEFREEFAVTVAECILSAKELAVYKSDTATSKTGKDGKRVYLPRHFAGNIVNNFITRLINSVEAVWHDKPASEGEGEGEGEGATRGTKAQARAPQDAIAASFNDALKKITRDAKAAEPKMADHAERRAFMLRVAKEWAAFK